MFSTLTGYTLLCGQRFEPVEDITVLVVLKWLENLEEMVPQYWH